MGAQRLKFILTLAILVLLQPMTHAQVTYDLDVDVVLDTVLYDGFNGAEDSIPAGYSRYRLYAVIPQGALMLGIAADAPATPSIPGFGYTVDCDGSIGPTLSFTVMRVTMRVMTSMADFSGRSRNSPTIHGGRPTLTSRIR